MEHYAQVTEADVKEAAKMSLINHAEKEVQKRVHNRVQNMAERSCTEPHESHEETAITPYNYESNQEFATACDNMQKDTNRGDLYLIPQGGTNEIP